MHKQSFQTREETEEILLQQLENLFDRPFLKPVQELGQHKAQEAQPGRMSAAVSSTQPVQPVQYKLQYEKDYSNTFLITNPQGIFKIFNQLQFLSLSEQSQVLLLDRLGDILQKCPHNIHILTDHISILNARRQNQSQIHYLYPTHPHNESSKGESPKERDFIEEMEEKDKQESDLLLLCIQICLKLKGDKLKSIKGMLELIKKITQLKRFSKFHLEYIFQYLKYKCTKQCQKGKHQKALDKIDSGIKILQGMFEPRFEFGPTSYFYFSGFLSGIQVNTKNIPVWPFVKGFAAAIWFQLSDHTFQDKKNLPVLFNCFSQGYGGFECYFNGRKLFYRILQRNYTLPTSDSNGVLIGEKDFDFEPKRWYFLGIEHDKPYLSRAQLSAFINDKHVVKFLPVDYPKFEKTAKLNMISLCKNFVGEMSTCVLFREQINNNKKFAQMYQQYSEQGIVTNAQMKQLNGEIFDSKINQKLFLFYCPERSYNKIVYDCVDLNDGELMVNSGIYNSGPKSKLFYCGGLTSLLPLLEYIQLISVSSDEVAAKLDSTVNGYLKLINSIMSSKSYSNHEADSSHFFKILFHLLAKLQRQSVNSQTIQLLAEIRFQIGDSVLQEQFFQNLLFSSDFWINTDSVEVINEYWSFIKAIYSQNPIQYNKIFSIQNLIDLMIKISDIKDGHCCEYHKNTSSMIYQGQGGGTSPFGFDESNRDLSNFASNVRQSHLFDKNQTTKQSVAMNQNHQKIYHIDKYLAPIAGVLEGVLTSGGNDILDQIQYVAKSLTIKSSPCFHLQMLKLLKVLLLDSKEDRHCASPVDFAAQFLNAKGLQILLYLCSNSSFDVKSMCIKLIDVLSSHTALIKMRIDTDLITYMCSIILPKQIVDSIGLSQKNQGFKNIGRLMSNDLDGGGNTLGNQYEMVEQDEEYKQSIEDEGQHVGGKNNMSQQEDEDIYNSTIQTNQMESSSFFSSQDLLKFKSSQSKDVVVTQQVSRNKDKQQSIDFTKDMGETVKTLKTSKGFGNGLFMDEEDSEEETGKDQSDSIAQVIQDKRKHQPREKNISVGESEDLLNKLDIGKDKIRNTEVKPPLAGPKGKKNPSLKFDISSNESSQQPQEDSKKKMNQTSKNMFGQGMSLTIDEAPDDALSESEELKQLEQFVEKKKFMNTQKIPTSRAKTSSKGGMASLSKFKGLELNIPEEELGGKKTSYTKSKQIMFAEVEEDRAIEKALPSEDEEEKVEPLSKKPVKTKFANENVMSKSNLRQPKSFNFGFPADDDSDEKDDLEEEKEEVKSKDQAKSTILLMNKGFKNSTMKGKPKPMIESDENDEGVNEPEPVKEGGKGKNQLIGGTTGATHETNYDANYSSEKQQHKKAVISIQKQSKLFTNANLKLNIDTDAINELFTYGGEKGEIKMTEDEEQENFEKEIEELACMCLASMKRKSPDEPVELEGENQQKKPTFEEKFLVDESKKGGSKSSNPRKQFMTPQSVRGIKKIEFQINQQEKLKRNEGGIANKTGTFSNHTIVEEQSPIGTSKSSSSKNDFNFGGTMSGNLQMTNSDIFSQRGEQPFEISGGEELIKKSIQNQHDLDLKSSITHSELLAYDMSPKMKAQSKEHEGQQYFHHFDQNLGNDEYTLELENLYTSCLEWILNRAPSSLFSNLVVDDFDKVNFTPALSLLMTLVTYSNNLLRQKALQDLHMLARWDSYNGTKILFHPQFHTWLLELLMPYQDLSNSYLNLSGPSLAVYDIGCKLHTLLLKNSCINPEEEAYKRINYVARWSQIITNIQEGESTRIRNQREVDTANKLSRILMTNLLQNLKEEAFRSRPVINESNPTWKNIIHTTCLVEEMVLGSTMKDFNAEQMQGEIGRDVNSSILKWIQKDFLLYQAGSTDKNLWAEWDMLEALFQTLDALYPEQFFKKSKDKGQGNQTIEENIFTLLEKSSADDLNGDIEVLMFEGKSNGPATSHQSIAQSNQTKGEKVKSHKNKILSLAAQALNIGQQSSSSSQANQPQNQQAYESSFMSTVLNLLCLALTQADTKQLVQTWLERLERFIKFLMILSETWKSRHINNYNIVQRKLQDAITFAFTFLFHEIHSSTNSKISQQNQTQSSMSQSSFNTHSPKDQVFGKIYAQSLKNLMIYFINVIEYSKIRYTPTQLESSVHLTACRGILNNILVKSYSQGQPENLISIKDLSKHKTADYDDFPECFYMEDWKVTFFYNETIKQIMKKQLNSKTIEAHILKRKNYALHQLDMQGRTEKTKDEILKRMQNDTLDIISQLSEYEFERKNKVALLNENIIREQRHYWMKAKRCLFGQRGIWQELGNKYSTNLQVRTNEGLKCFMKDKDHNGFIFIKDLALEKKIFKQVDKLDMSFPPNTHHTKALTGQESKPKKQKEEKKQKAVKSQVKKSDSEQDEDEEEEEEDEEDDDEEELVQELESQRDQNQNAVTSIQFFSKPLATREKIALKKTFTSHLKEYIIQQKPKCKEILGELKCSLLKPFYQRSGYVCLTSHDIIFFDDLYVPSNQAPEIENIFFFEYQKPEDELLYKIMPLQNIKEIQRRRFLGKKAALEIFMMDNSSFLLNFSIADERDQFAKKVVRQRNQKCQNLKYYDTLEPKRILKKRELTEKWMQWKMSNFEYIMNLNSLAGRSFNDLSQYPVVPWIFADYAGESMPDIQSTNSYGGAAPSGFRDLNKNMQLLGSAERQATLKSKYEDPDNELSKFHCGSHYSNPGIVLHYLCRLSPYIDAYVELHGKGLDKPDRTFNSIKESLYSALNDQTDIRELIPEFFFCPEMFVNKNMVNFGTRQDDEVVGDVNLPPWSHNDPFTFVMQMREAFESSYVSMNLGGWIDYIFGCKQRDQEAERSLNTFSQLTYEDGIDIDSVQDDIMKKSYQSQIYNFGQTPSQLFQKNQKHPNKIPRNQLIKFSYVIDAAAKIKVYKPVVQQQAIQQKNQPGFPQQQTQKIVICNEAILKAKFFDDQTIVGANKDGTVTYFIWLSRAHELNPTTPFTCCEDRKKKYDSRTKQGGLDMYDRSIKKFDFPMIILMNGKFIIRGGFWDGKLLVCPFEGQNSEQVISFSVHQGTVTAIASTANEKTLITGSKYGDIVIWSNNFGQQGSSDPIFSVQKHFCDHEGQISNIHINEEMNLFLTCSFDGTANLYNLWSCKLIRVFKHPNLSPIHSGILCQTPLPAACLFSREDHYWHSYSINGNLLDKQREECSHIISPIVAKDSYFMDKLVYGTERGYIMMRSLPLLKVIKKLQVSNNYPVLSILLSNEKKFLLVGCGDGGLNVITEPHVVQTPQAKNSSLATQSQSSSQQTANF